MVMTKEQTANIVARLYAAGNQKMPEHFQLTTWHDAIKHVDFEIAVRATKEAIMMEERTPSVAVFLSYVEEAQGLTAPSYEDAITEVLEKLITVGRYQTPEWSNELIERSVRSIGWLNICDSEDDYWKNDFRRAYTNMSHRDSKENKIAITSNDIKFLIGGLADSLSMGVEN